MRHFEIIIKGKKYQGDVPADWSEMDSMRFRSLVALSDGKMSSEHFFCSYFGLNAAVAAKLDMYTVFKLCQLILSAENVTLDKFIIPDVTSGSHLFVAPYPQLANMTFQQFMTVDTFYTWYLQTKERKYVQMMAMCLYLKEGENVESFDEDERLKQWESVESSKVNALLLNWTFIKNWLSKCYPYLLPSGGKEQEQPKQNNKIKMFNAWSEVMDTLVGEDLTRIESYKNLQCMDVLRILNRRIKESREKR